jgi:hypothetical protein
LGRRAAGASPWRAHGGDGGQVEGGAGEGVSQLLLARLVRSASISELGRRYWRGRLGRRSTRGGGRWWPVKLAPGPEVLGGSLSRVLHGEGKVGSSSPVRMTTVVGERWRWRARAAAKEQRQGEQRGREERLLLGVATTGIRTGRCGAWATRGGREGRWHGRSNGNCHSAAGTVRTNDLPNARRHGRLERFDCRTGPGPIHCRNDFPIFKLPPNFEIQNEGHPDVQKY